jgi:SAM-dependent methyltransferase
VAGEDRVTAAVSTGAIGRELICLVCGSSDCQNGGSLYRCSRCGSAANKSVQSIDYYEDHYAVTQPLVADTEHRRLWRFPEQVELLRHITARRPAPATLLDVGCDKGYFIDQARRQGYEVMGVEPSRVARSYCERVELTVVKDLASVKKTFDVVTMWHSLEHFPDPNQVISDVCRLLNNPGHLFIRVPDYGCLWSRLAGDRWIWYQPQNHYVHFTSSGLNSLLTRHGFSSVRIRSRRPNNILTNVSFSLASACFGRRSLKKTLGRFYEQLTGVELFCCAERR